MPQVSMSLVDWAVQRLHKETSSLDRYEGYIKPCIQTLENAIKEYATQYQYQTEEIERLYAQYDIRSSE